MQLATFWCQKQVKLPFWHYPLFKSKKWPRFFSQVPLLTDLWVTCLGELFTLCPISLLQIWNSRSWFRHWCTSGHCWKRLDHFTLSPGISKICSLILKSGWWWTFTWATRTNMAAFLLCCRFLLWVYRILEAEGVLQYHMTWQIWPNWQFSSLVSIFVWNIRKIRPSWIYMSWHFGILIKAGTLKPVHLMQQMATVIWKKISFSKRKMQCSPGPGKTRGLDQRISHKCRFWPVSSLYPGEILQAGTRHYLSGSF